MLPPIDSTTLERNPNFDVLYKDLCARKLNPDGSTRDTKKQRMHGEIREVSLRSLNFGGSLFNGIWMFFFFFGL